MASLRVGQRVLVRGQEGVIEALDLTPGMADVRYGSLVKRHRKDLLVPSGSARSNPKLRGRKSGRKSSRKGRRRARRNTSTEKSFAARLRAAESNWERIHAEVDAQHQAGSRPSKRLMESLLKAKDAVTSLRLEMSKPPRPVRAKKEGEGGEEPKTQRTRKRRLRPARGSGGKRKEKVGSSRVSGGALQLQFRSEGAAWFTVKDPPRFEGGAYAMEPRLCGNPIDGTMYVIAVAGTRRSVGHVVNEVDAAEALALWMAKHRGEEPESMEEVLNTIAGKYGARRVQVQGKESFLEAYDSKDGVEPLTQAEVEYIKTGGSRYAGEQGRRVSTPDSGRGQSSDPFAAQYTRRRRSEYQMVKGHVRKTGGAQKAASPGIKPPPRNTFFSPYGGGYVFFKFWGSSTPSQDRLFRIQPPFERHSAKSRSPFFSWTPLNRPLLTDSNDPTELGSPMCISEDQKRVLSAVQKASSHLYALKTALGSLASFISVLAGYSTTGRKDYPAETLERMGDRFLSSIAWASGWVSREAQAWRSASDDGKRRVPNLMVFGAIAGGPLGLNPQLLLSAATADPSLIMPESRRSAKGMRYGGKELSDLSGELNRRLLGDNYPQLKLAQMIVEVWKAVGFISGDEAVSKSVARLERAAEGFFLSDKELYRLETARSVASRGTAKSVQTREAKRVVKEIEEKRWVLGLYRAMFYAYNIVGGHVFQRQVSSSLSTLTVIRQNGGRLTGDPSELQGSYYSRLQLEQAIKEREAELRWEKEALEEDPKLRGMRHRLSSMKGRQQTFVEGTALSQIGKGVRYYYTFNPVLFEFTRWAWTRSEVHWPADVRSQDLTEDQVAALNRIDRAGRYGASLKVYYEEAADDADSEVMPEAIAARLQLREAVAAVDQGETEAEEMGEEPNHGAIGLEVEAEYPDLALIEPGRGGKFLIAPMCDIEGESMEAAEFAADPIADLNRMKKEAVEDLLLTRGVARERSSESQSLPLPPLRLYAGQQDTLQPSSALAALEEAEAASSRLESIIQRRKKQLLGRPRR
jgi:hypothetical protein